MTSCYGLEVAKRLRTRDSYPIPLCKHHIAILHAVFQPKETMTREIPARKRTVTTPRAARRATEEAVG